MKIHLVKNEKDAIKGYKAIVYSPAKHINNLDLLSDNECDFILAGNIVDDFSLSEAGEIISNLLRKLRINGTIAIGGTDLRLFCKSVINNLISESDASELIKTKQSMTNLNIMLETMRSAGLKIQSSKITGVHYEITAVRS
jgi:predicted SAM-dependent methyltransferase